MPSFARRAREWSSPPLDDIGYLPSADLLDLEDDKLIEMIQIVESNRYGGWRNYEGRWRSVLKLDQTSGKVVLDYGCGVGVEALQYAKGGNTVMIADISEGNVILAERVLHLWGFEPGAVIVLKREPPFADLSDQTLDVIHCNGVLHHIPKPAPVVEQFSRWLKPGGELRLMVYSNYAWIIATGTEPPDDVTEDEHFQQYVQTWDAVGGYSDWYDRWKLAGLCAPYGFEVESCEYLTEHREYLGAILRRT